MGLEMEHWVKWVNLSSKIAFSKKFRFDLGFFWEKTRFFLFINVELSFFLEHSTNDRALQDSCVLKKHESSLYEVSLNQNIFKFVNKHGNVKLSGSNNILKRHDKSKTFWGSRYPFW